MSWICMHWCACVTTLVVAHMECLCVCVCVCESVYVYACVDARVVGACSLLVVVFCCKVDVCLLCTCANVCVCVRACVCVHVLAHT